MSGMNKATFEEPYYQVSLSKDKIETLSDVVLLKMLIFSPFLTMFVLDVFHCTPQLNSGKQ